MKKKFLIIITLVFLTTLLGVFVVENNVNAAGLEKGKSSCCPHPCEGKGPEPIWDTDKGGQTKYIRMQIAIPGVTESCTYEVEALGENEKTKTCHYIKANLPFYIKQLYKFALGAIAIMAVLMIMIGGLKWVFAAGNPTAIGEARSTITAAVSGLILALLSYVILNTINPSLTKLTMIKPGDINPIEQGTTWCHMLPERVTEISLKKDGSDSIEKNKGKCEESYYYGTFSGSQWINLGKDQKCWGYTCPHNPDEEKFGVCAYYTGFSTPSCFDIKDFCENQPVRKEELCKAVDDVLIISQKKGYGCVFRDKGGIKYTDRCHLDPRLVCSQSNEERVDCTTPTALNVCYGRLEDGSVAQIVVEGAVFGDEHWHKEKQSSGYSICKDMDETAVKKGSIWMRDTHFICCRDTSDNSFRREKVNACYENVNACSDYNNEYECRLDRCGVGAIGCRWDSSGSGSCRSIAGGGGGGF